MQQAAVAMVFVLTIAGLYARPPRLHDWHVAIVGALLAWLLSPLSLGDGVLVIRHSWNIVAFFAGLMLLGAAADEAGLYRAAAAFLARSASGRPRAVRTLATGAATTAILSNDATPLILTPAVFAAAASLAAAMAPALATTFIADGASLLLPISNPVNLLFYERFDIGLGWYLTHIFPAALAGATALGVVIVLRTPPAAVAIGAVLVR